MLFSAKVDFVKHHVIPIIRKEPKFLKIPAGTKDVPYSTSWEIIDNFLILKLFITDNLLKYKIVISTPTLLAIMGKQH